MSPAVEIRDLCVRAADGSTLLDTVSLTLDPGRVLAVIGPSGAGKSTLGLAVLGETEPGLRLDGSVRIRGTELSGLGPAALRHARAGRVGHLPQHPGLVLDPVRRTGAVLDELAALLHGRDRAARDAAVRRAVDRAGLGGEPELARRFPHQLSGGQQQRMALAQTLVTGPDVVVLDEPTTGLDPATTEAVLDRLAALAAAGTALVLLTHDMRAAEHLAHDVLELDRGRITGRELPSPARHTGRPARAAAPAVPRLEVDALGVRASGVPILSDVDFTLQRGELLVVVGPSGAGKTTLGRALAGLIRSTGSVLVDGRPAAGDRRAVQYVHQESRAAFLDHRPVLDQVARPAVLLRGASTADAQAEATALLERLGLDAATVRRRPGGLSGGQLQRASVARALVARPAVLVADEPTSALDGTHRELLLAELDRARDDGIAVVLISHDPAVVTGAPQLLTLDAGRIRPSSDAGRGHHLNSGSDVT